MRSLYLILVLTAVVVTSKPQRRNYDIIWYPIDDEEGVFVSVYGEKRKTEPYSRVRNPRRARHSEMQIPGPLSFEPTENQDPSFFHNIRERRPFATIPPIQKIPPSLLAEEYFTNQRNRRLQYHNNQNFYGNTFQDIVNEVFDYKTFLHTSEYPFSRPGTNQFDIKPITEIQWGNTVTEIPNQWNKFGQKPFIGTQLGGMSSSLLSQNPQKQAKNVNQWGNVGSRPSDRPPNKEWVIPGGNQNRPNNSARPSRPTNQSDKLIFPDEDSNTSFVLTTTTSDVALTEAPTRSPCENACPVTPEFNPVCGSDALTYSNAGRLKCAQMCGKNVRLAHYGSCGRTKLTTPLVSK